MRYVTGLPKPERDARLMVMLQGYFDASGSKNQNSVISLAGFITNSGKWTEFSDDWDKLLKRYHLSVFKMQVQSKRKPIKERNARISEFVAVIKRHILLPRFFLRSILRLPPDAFLPKEGCSERAA